jgi:hypothetical protein
MHWNDCAPSWRLFTLNWIPLGVLGALLGAAILFGGFSLSLGSAVIAFGFVATYAAVAFYNAYAPHRRDPQVVFVLGTTAQIVLATTLVAPLTYVAGTTGLPIQDANLLAADRALGLDWRAYAAAIDRQPLLAAWLSYGYTMIKWPIFAIPVFLAATHRYLRLQEFILAFVLSLAAAAVISAVLPAYGAFYGLGPQELPNLERAIYNAQIEAMTALRAGGWRELDLLTLSGIVTFPSFHAASAVLYTWALWPVRWMRPVVLTANGVMLAATPINGAHYFIDVIGGVALAAAAIAFATTIGRRFASAMPDVATSLVAPATVPAE